MDIRFIGGILLIVGTSIGAGMLALPVSTAELGFIGSVIVMLTCWLVLTVSAFLILEVNLALPQRTNLISMAGVTLGPLGQIIAWLAYLLLLYALLCAYIAGGSDLLHYLLASLGNIETPRWLSATLFTFIFSITVYLGIRTVDYMNRGLMMLKLLAYLGLIVLLIPFISYEKLSYFAVSHLYSGTALTVTITSFGFAIIIPSLRVYFEGDVKKIRKAIMIGSLIPLICYFAWDAAIMGVIPLTGEQSLSAILHSPDSTSGLITLLTKAAQQKQIIFFAKLFTSICVLTSFLGVSLCLTDFLADGLSLEKKGKSALLIHAITFLPPLILVLFFPNAFIKALEYAGIYSIILLILLPVAMAWGGRYFKKLTSPYHVKGGKLLLSIVFVLGGAMMASAIFSIYKAI